MLRYLLKSKCGLVLLPITVMMLASGCGPSDSRRQFRLAHQFDPNLTEDQIQRMCLPLTDVRLQGPNDLIMNPLPRTECDVEAGKKYLSGRWLMRHNETKPAVLTLKAALDKDPDNALLWELLAQGYFGAGYEKGAVEAARRAIELDQYRMTAFQVLGSVKAGAGDFQAAAFYFQQALNCPQATTDNPVTPVINLQFAQALTKLGYLKAAVEQYHLTHQGLLEQLQYGQTNPLSSQLVSQAHRPVLMQADLLICLGQMDQAVKTLEKAQEELQTNTDLVNVLLMVIASGERPLEVRTRQVETFAEYLLDQDRQAEDVIEYCYQAYRALQKTRQFFVLIDKWTGKLITVRQAAFALSISERVDDAQTILQSLVDTGSEDPLVFRDLARIYAHKKDSRPMILAYGEYISRAPDSNTQAVIDTVLRICKDIESLSEKIPDWADDFLNNTNYAQCFLLAQVADQKEMPDFAENLLRSCLKKNPEFAPARKELVELLLRRQSYQQVLNWIKGNGSETDPEMLWYAGHAYAGLEDLTKAAQTYRKVISLQQDEVRAYLALGEILARQSNFADAEDILIRASANWPNEDQGYAQLTQLYARWAAQDGLDESFAETISQRAWEMYRRWFEDATEDQFNQRRLEALSAFEKLAQEYPRGKVINIILSQFYAALNRNDDALAVIEKLAEHYPEERQVLSVAARLNTRADNFTRAAELRRQSWETDPNDTIGLAVTLRAYQKAENTDTAYQILDDFLQNHKYNWKDIGRIQNQTRWIFMVNRQYETAVDLFGSWLWKISDTAADTEKDQKLLDNVRRALYENLVWSLTQSRQFKRAAIYTIDWFNRYKPEEAALAHWLINSINIWQHHDLSLNLIDQLLILDPQRISFTVEKFITLIDADRTDEGLELAQKWVDEEPEDLRRQQAYVLLLRGADKFAPAAQYLRQLFQINPGNESIRMQLAEMLLLAEDYPAAQEVLDKWNPTEQFGGMKIDALIRLATARGDCSAAVALLDKMLGKLDSEIINEWREQLWFNCGQVNQALELRLEKFQSHTEPEDQKNDLLRLSVYYEKLGQIDKSIESLEKLLAFDENDPGVMNNLGYTLTVAGQQTDRAQELLERSLRLDPESGPTLDSLGWLRYKCGDFEQALVYIRQAAARLGSVDAEILDHLGDVLYRLGQVPQAQKCYQRARQDLITRTKTEKYLGEDLDRIERKLTQLEQNQEVTTAELFAK